MDDYMKFISPGLLGYYNFCEICTVYLIDKRDKSNVIYHNLFTLFYFDEIDLEYIGKINKPETVNKYFSIGVYFKHVTIDEATTYYNRLHNIKQNVVNIGERCLRIGDLEYVPKEFVPADSTDAIRLNKVLKNNFNNGSYILEFFDVTKPLLNLLSEPILNKVKNKLLEILPIDLVVIEDRIGNFIFQFPSYLIDFTHNVKNKSDNELEFKFSIDQRNSDYMSRYLFTVENIFDNCVSSIYYKKLDSLNFNIVVNNVYNLFVFSLVDLDNNVLILRETTALMGRLEFSMQHNCGERTIINSSGTKKIQLIGKINTIKAGHIPKGSWKKHVENRQYTLRIDEIESSKEFISYSKNIPRSREKALLDLIYLMNKISYSGGTAYIWDPYLTAKDILDTWYYTNGCNVNLKAITSSSAKGNIDLPNWITEQQQTFNNSSNNHGINLEFRVQCDGYGYKFHDRFIMIKSFDDKILSAYSLGTSINSVGKSHHIIQKVLHPQNIIDDFERLWKELEKPECIVWKKCN